MSTTEQLKSAIATRKTTAPAPQAKTKTLLDVIGAPKFMNQIKLALPNHLTAERLLRIVTTECRKVPQLLACNPESFYGAVLQAAQLGLRPGGALGHCYLLPYGNGKGIDGRPNAQLIIGYRGMIDLARRSGQIESINAFLVHEKDEFEVRYGINPTIKHKPCLDMDRGSMTYVYAVAKLKDGGYQFEVMSRAEIEKIKATSKSANSSSSPWNNYFEEMAKKTVIRRLFKMLPVSIQAMQAVYVDEKSERGRAVTTQDYIDAEYANTGVRNDELVRIVNEPVEQAEVIE